jgi:hypothetical protein
LIRYRPALIAPEVFTKVTEVFPNGTVLLELTDAAYPIAVALLIDSHFEQLKYYLKKVF